MDSVTSLRLKVDSTDVVTAQRNLNNLGTESKKLETGIASLSAKLIGGALAFGSISAAASSFISTAGKFEQYAVSLKVLSGSAAAAEKSFAWVKDFTAKTPYTLDETMEAFIRLKAYGIDATNGSLKTLGDTAAAMGKPLMAAVEAMADAMVGENERLKEFGIRASKEGDTIAYKWMDSSGKAKQQIIQNNGEIIKSTLEAIFNEKYAGMMDEQSKTWVGAVSNLEDTWTSFKDSLARDSGIFEAAKETVKGLNEALNGQNETLNTLLPIVASLGVTYGVMKTASIGAALTETALDAIRSKSIVTTTAYNAALMRNVTTTTTLTAAQTASAVAASAMGTAMKAVPFLAVAGVVSSLAMAFFDAKKNSDELRNSLDQTAESLAKLTKNQLEFREASIAANIMDKGLELRKARVKAQSQGIFQSDLEYKEELANLDMLKQEYKGLMTAGQQVRDFKSGKLKPVEETKPKAEVTTTATELTKAQTAAQKKAAKEAEKLRQEEADIQRGYLESYAEIQANAALEEYNVKLGYEEAYREFAVQEAIAQYEMELTMLNDLAERQAQSAIAFYEMTRSEKDKINEENLALYEANAGLFNDEQMQTFFTKWQESIEGVKGGYNEIEGIVSSFVEDSLNSKDWTAGLTGTNKALANVGNAYKDIQKQTVKYDKAVKKVNDSQLTDEEKKIELKKIEEAQIGAEIGAYSNLAGAMSGFFEEGSKGAEAMTAVSATLGIAQGIQAIISAWGSAPFPFNMPAVAATTAAVLPMIGQLTGMGGSGGGSSGGGASSEGFSSLSRTEQIERQYDPMIDRLDKQIELLESIDKNGSAQALNVAQSAVTFERDLRVLIEESFKTIKQGGTLAKSVSSISASSIESSTGVDFYAGRRLNQNTLRDMGNFLTFASTASQNLAYFAGRKDFERQISLDTFITNVKEVIGDFALSMGESVSEMSDAKDTFKTIFDDITGTTYYATLDLVKAYGEVNNLIGDKDLPTYLKAQITAIETVEDAFGSQIENILNMSNDFKTQVEATQMLNRLLGTTFEAGTAEALNYIESIELVGDKMVQVREDVKSVFENIQDFIDDLTDTSIQNPSVTFGVFSESFNSMIDAISSGSEDMIDISGKAMDNAKSYIDVVTATATSRRDIEFAKAIMVNKFSGVIATPDLTLNNINNTLNNNNAQLVAELQALKFELNSIKNMTIDQVAATQSSLVSLRGILGEVSA